MTAALVFAAALKFLFACDHHVESDFIEGHGITRGNDVYTMWKPGDHAALVETYRFINTNSACRGISFALFGGDQINTGYDRYAEDMAAERRNYFRTLETLNLAHDEKVADLDFVARPWICRENLADGQMPYAVTPVPLRSRVIAIQGNHDTGVREFYRDAAFTAGNVRFITFFASYVGLTPPPGKLFHSTAKISDETLAFVADELSKAAADPKIRHTVLVSHWAIAPAGADFDHPIIGPCPENGENDNRGKLLALAERYGCRLFLNGHEHNGRFPVGMVGVLADVNCGTLTASPTPAEGVEHGGAFSIVEIDDHEARLTVYSRAVVEDVDGRAVLKSSPRVMFVRRIPLDSPHEFRGKWITDAPMATLQPKKVFSRQLERKRLPPPDERYQNRHILFRKSFELESVPKRAKVFVSADDCYKLYVNGVFAGQGPASGYIKRTYYNEIDVTALLRPGRNVLAVHTYYQGLVNRVWVSGDNRHGLVLDLVADGKPLLASDPSFVTACHSAYSSMGKAGYDTQFLERYDAGAAEVGFERPDFNDSAWIPATPHPHGDDYVLCPQPTPMLEFESIRPVRSEILPNGTFRLDFGGIYVGNLVFSARGPKGGTVEIRMGQELLPDGSVRHKLRANCDYVESFVMSGRFRDTLNQFDYKSFRHAELEPSAGVAIDPQSIVLRARHLPFRLKAKPELFDPAVAPIWKLCTDSFRYGVQEQVMDCMEREKGYYLGDGCYTMLAYCKLTDDWSAARRFFDDFLYARSIDRGLVTCGCCSLMQEIAEFPLMFIWFANEYIRETGDAEFIGERYAQLADILDCYRERYARADGLIANLDKWCLVEWPRDFRDGYDADLREGHVSHDTLSAVNAWYLGAICSMNEIAAKTGHGRYADLKPLKAAFRCAFYDPERHLFVDREGSRHVSLPGNVYAAFFGLSDDPAYHPAFVDLVRRKRYSSISLFQFFPLFSYLRAHGEEALYRELVLSPDAWLRNLHEGATRTFEGWGKDTKHNTSLFHLTIAALAYFLNY